MTETATDSPATAELDRPRGWARDLVDRGRAALHEPEQVLTLLLLAAFVLRAIWITVPQGSLIFDEAYYVTAARVLLGWPLATGAHYAGSALGLDPNTEHPPLGKVLMAGSMALFGDNGLGWRLPSIIFGMIALVAVYRIVLAAGESRWLGVLAVGFFAFDNLALVHSRIGTLDIMVLAPLLLASWAALRGRWAAAGALLGLAMLLKITALYGLLALLILQALTLLGTWRRNHRIRLLDVRPTAVMVAVFAIVTGAGLWALDLRFTTYTNPIDHLAHMLQYGAALTRQGGPPTGCTGNDSAPWQWLVNDCQMTYLRTAVTVKSGSTIISDTAKIDFRGAMNPVLLGAIWVAIPFAAWFAWRKRSRLATWSLVWMAANYLPFIPLALIDHRITYIYYFLPIVPALGIAVAVFLLRSGLPRIVMYSYVVAYVVGFAALYPFRVIP